MGYRHASVIHEVSRLYRLGAVGGVSDAQLIARFLARQDDGADAAFEGLVERHGPMVMHVCRGVLRDEHDAEDAFQTTFVVLARKARTLWVTDSLASWLHGVAYRVASRARVDAMRRLHHERQAAARMATESVATPDVSRSESEAIIAEEIARLPEKYRDPTILCYLEAMSYEAAANRLGLTEDAVRGRLAQARERLRSRLTRRGVDASAVVGAARYAIPAMISVRPALLRSTIHAAMNVSARMSVQKLLTYESAKAVGERIGTTMIRTKLRTALLTTLTFGVIAAGVVAVAQPTGGRRDQAAGPPPRRDTAARASSADRGNLIVDWIPAASRSEKIEVTVDATRHCVHLAEMSLKRDAAAPNDGAVRLDLQRGTTYTVAASGEAFMTESTGPDADPFPGVVLVYGTDEEDGYAIRQTVLAPGKSITFKTPWAINPEDEVCLMAFFLDTSPETAKRGSYKLIVTAADKTATKVLWWEAVDFVDPSAEAQRELNSRRQPPRAVR